MMNSGENSFSRFDLADTCGGSKLPAANTSVNVQSAYVDSGVALASKLRLNSEISNQGISKPATQFVLIMESLPVKRCSELLNRINRSVKYGPIDDPHSDVFVGKDGLIVPPPKKSYMLGVSHFVPTDEYFNTEQNSFHDLNNGCSHLGNVELPPGIDYHHDRPLRRLHSSRNLKDMGLHFSIFPTVPMTVEEFERKWMSLLSQFAGGGEPNDLSDCPTPEYSLSDVRLRQASAALFEMAASANTDPHRRGRALYFHYLLAEEDAEYSWLLNGDALTYYTAAALESCATSDNMSIEEVRDEIRGDLAAVILYRPTFRSYPEDYWSPLPCSVVLFGENLTEPLKNDDDYGDYN